MDIHTVIQSQYHASLDMLAQTIKKCPDKIWNRSEDKNLTWQLAYHTLFYTHLYLSPNEEKFSPWEKHRPDYYNMNTSADLKDEEPKIDKPYTKTEILEYLELLQGQIDEMVSIIDLHAESGFHWLPFNKLELQLYNIRHLMQHTGELGERLGYAEKIEIDWIGKRK